MIERLGGSLSCSREQAFDIVADIERYPEFLRWWTSARIIERHANIWYVDQEVGFGPVKLRFEATAVMQRPERIDITSTDESFDQFSMSWAIAQTASEGCRISLAASVKLRAAFLNYAVASLLPIAVDEIIIAFETRARALYTKPKQLGRM